MGNRHGVQNKQTGLLDPKIITWAIIDTFSPRTNIFKKMVKSKFGKFAGSKHLLYFHFANKKNALSFVNELKTSKTCFSAILITDEQFGQIQTNWSK